MTELIHKLTKKLSCR